MKINLLPVLLISGSFFSQDRTTASGGDINNASGSISYSIGLIDYNEISGLDGTINQGVQQPYELFSVGIVENDENFTITVFPNPTSQQLTLTFEDDPDQNLQYNLLDEAGKLLIEGEINSKNTVLDLASLPVASYFLNIKSFERNFRTYKIIKNH